MINEMKEIYQKPCIKVVELQAERGFAGSGEFVRNASNATLFNMLFSEAPRNEQFSVDDWNSAGSDDGQFSVEDWGEF